MKSQISSSVVATGKSKISNAKIKKNQSKNVNDSTNTDIIESSIVAGGGSQINGAEINLTQEKKKSFWKGFVGGIVASVLASAIWYFILKIIEKHCH